MRGAPLTHPLYPPPPSITVTVCFSYNQSAGSPEYNEQISERTGGVHGGHGHVWLCKGACGKGARRGRCVLGRGFGCVARAKTRVPMHGGGGVHVLGVHPRVVLEAACAGACERAAPTAPLPSQPWSTSWRRTRSGTPPG